jgi:hypothetical protein
MIEFHISTTKQWHFETYAIVCRSLAGSFLIRDVMTDERPNGALSLTREY